MARVPARVRKLGTFVLATSISLGACASGTHESSTGSVTRKSVAKSTSTVEVPTTAPAPPTGREGVPAFSHLFVVVMENLSEQGALATPAIAELAHEYSRASSYYAVSHPSLPNYLAMVSGSTWGIGSDCTGCHVSGANLASQLEAVGVSWDAYFENMPGSCFTGAQSPDGLYAKKHDPFIYFDDVRDDPALCRHLQPFTALGPLLAQGASSVPRFVWVTPNLCHDGHDCSPDEAGAWLSGFVGSVTSSDAWRRGGALIVTWDEGTADDGIDPSTGGTTSSGGGRVLTIVAAPGIPAGKEVSVPYDHYSLLRTIEDAFGLPLLAQGGAAGIRPLSAFWSG